MRKLFFAVALAFVSLASTAQNLSLNPFNSTRVSLDDICARQNSNKFGFTLA